VGPELMPALGDALASLAPQAQVVPLLHLSGKQRAFADGAVDPHAWLDPANAAAWLQTIADRLSALDPDNAGTYRDNARAAQQQLTADDAAWAARLTPVKGRAFVAYHDALGYFTDHYGLQIVGSIELGDASTPSAAQLVGIRDIITTGQAVCVFPETGRDPKFIASLTEGLQIKVGAPQDIEFIDTPPGRGQYRVLLEALVTSMVDCLKP
jgi:zinc transport system substrate-binding protein